MEIQDYGVLLRGITSNVNEYISEKIEKYGVKQGQFEYFLLIYNSPGINQLELARLKNVGKASVTKALKILEKDGFITRTPDEKDKRNTLCYISEKGDKIVDDLMNVKAKAQLKLFDNFTEEEKIRLHKYLSKLYKNSKKLATDMNNGGKE